MITTMKSNLFQVSGSGFGVEGRILGFWFRVEDSGIRVWGFGFWVWG